MVLVAVTVVPAAPLGILQPEDGDPVGRCAQAVPSSQEQYQRGLQGW